ncbi:hypothetical protein MTO96_026821 [Rhipicephalus appendiculatus]
MSQHPNIIYNGTFSVSSEATTTGSTHVTHRNVSYGLHIDEHGCVYIKFCNLGIHSTPSAASRGVSIVSSTSFQTLCPAFRDSCQMSL